MSVSGTSCFTAAFVVFPFCVLPGVTPEDVVKTFGTQEAEWQEVLGSDCLLELLGTSRLFLSSARSYLPTLWGHAAPVSAPSQRLTWHTQVSTMGGKKSEKKRRSSQQKKCQKQLLQRQWRFEDENKQQQQQPIDTKKTSSGITNMFLALHQEDKKTET